MNAGRASCRASRTFFTGWAPEAFAVCGEGGPPSSGHATGGAKPARSSALLLGAFGVVVVGSWVKNKRFLPRKIMDRYEGPNSMRNLHCYNASSTFQGEAFGVEVLLCFRSPSRRF